LIGLTIEIPNPVPVVLMHHLLWEHPHPWVLPHVKPYKIFFYHPHSPPPLFSSDTPSSITRGEMKKEKKKRGWVFQKTKCPPVADKKIQSIRLPPNTLQKFL
jgi:hypothetical protein